MPYIILDPETLAVSVDARKGGADIAISTAEALDKLTPLYWVALSGIKRPPSKLKRLPPAVAPWLGVVAAIIWEGLLQGLSWEVLKGLVLDGITKMREKGLMPTVEARSVKGQVEAGFRHAKYSEAAGLDEYFVGVKARFDFSSHVQRVEVTRPREYAKLCEEHDRQLNEQRKHEGRVKGRSGLYVAKGRPVKKRAAKGGRTAPRKRGPAS